MVANKNISKGVNALEIKASKLFEVMTLLKPAIAKKVAIKSAMCVCLHDGKAIATDLETMIIANLPEATESILLPYAEIAASLAYIPGNDSISIEQSGKTVMLRWSNGDICFNPSNELYLRAPR